MRLLNPIKRYDDDFICDLIKQLDNKIALGSNKDYKSNIYNLGVSKDISKYNDLVELSSILDKILKCHSCYSDVNMDDLVSLVKNKLNNC